MNFPIRTLSAADAEIMARNVVTRTSVKGCVECHGLIWRSDALLEWEIRQREAGQDPKVEVRIDELDLHVVYVDVPEPGVGPYMAQSRQPEFTQGLSLFELNRLKKAVKDKELSERLGRLSDEEATRLRIEFYAQLGHGDDPVAQKRLSEIQNQFARLRLLRTGEEVPLEPTPSTSAKPATRKKTPAPSQSAKKQNKTKPSTSPAPASLAAAGMPNASVVRPEAATPIGSLEDRQIRKFPSIRLKRTTP